MLFKSKLFKHCIKILWNILYANLNEHEHQFVLNDETGIIASVHQTNHSTTNDVKDDSQRK
jgi:hypothetical protein